jgi:hypothetical protein
MTSVGATLRRHWPGLAASVAIVLLPFWEVLAGRRTTIYGDVPEVYVPSYARVWELIREGQWPWWDPSTLGGTSLLGAGQSAVFYPFIALYGWLEPTNATRWYVGFHLVLGAVAMYAWAYHRWRSTPGAVIAAVSLSLGSFHVLHLVHLNFFAQVAWLPLAFLGVDLLAERWTTGRAAVLAVPMAMIVVIGGPPVVWITVLGLGLYAAFGSPVGRDRLRSDLRIAGGFAIGVGLGAVQLLPTYLYSKTSVRPQLPREEAFTFASQPRHLLNLVFPYAYGGATQPEAMASGFLAGPFGIHEVLQYAGVTVLVLAVVAVCARWRDRLVRGLVVIAVVGLVIAMADSTPAGEYVYRFVPLASRFRSWGRAGLLTQLALAVLAALGARAVLEAPRRFVRHLVVAAGAVAVLAAVAPRIHSVNDALAPGAIGLLGRVIPLLLVVLLLVAVLLHAHYPRAVPVLLVAVVGIDLVLYASGGEWYRDGYEPAAYAARYREDPGFGPVHDAGGGTDRWASNSAQRGVALETGTETVLGYDPLIPEDYARTVAELAYQGFPTQPDLWTSASLSDVLRITTLALASDITPTAEGWRRADVETGDDIVRWIRRPRLPDAYLVGAAPPADLDSIRAALDDPSTPWPRQAFVEEPLDEPLDDPGRAGTVLRSDVTGDGEIEIDATRDALLVVSYAWLDGWEATVDGEDVPVVRANGVVLGIPVPAGRHTVHLRFVPPGLRLGALISALSLMALILTAPVMRWAGRRRARASAGFPALEEHERVEPRLADVHVGPHGQVEGEGGDGRHPDHERERLAQPPASRDLAHGPGEADGHEGHHRREVVEEAGAEDHQPDQME